MLLYEAGFLSLLLLSDSPFSYCSFFQNSAQYATGDQWRTNSRKNEEMEPINTQLWM